MISCVSQVTVPVVDQERAKAFWTDKVGFELHTNEPYGDERWIEIAPPDGPLLILDSRPEDEGDRPDRGELPDSPVLFTCDDIQRTHRELTERGALLEPSRGDAVRLVGGVRGRPGNALRARPERVRR